MDFSEEQTSGGHIMLPQFFELTSRTSPIVTTSSEYSSGGNEQSQTVQTPIHTIAASTSQKQTLVNFPVRYTGAPAKLTWTDSNTLMPAINIPNYSQNNAILNIQANSLSSSIIPTMYLASTSQTDVVKQEMSAQSTEQKDLNMETQMPHNATLTMAEYIQKLQAAATLPIALQQLIKFQQVEQIKKEKVEEDKTEHLQSNILNIPSVPVFRNTQLQNSNNFTNVESVVATINPSDLNIHMENEQENESLQPVTKVEQQIQTDLPRIERKSKFRAKIGEIKTSLTADGTTVYYCPECHLGFPDKIDIEPHIQAHIQDRKYECKECGAMLKRKEHLDQHMRGHSNERPYKCSVCEKAFKRNEHLTRHYVIHSGDKRFSCTVCQKAFSRKDHLTKHTQTHSGLRKNKTRKDTYYIDQKDVFDKSIDSSQICKQETYLLKDSLPKQDSTFHHIQDGILHNIQNFPKDPNLLHTLSSLKEQLTREAAALQQGNVDTSSSAQNVRYIMPS